MNLSSQIEAFIAPNFFKIIWLSNFLILSVKVIRETPRAHQI